MKTWKEHAHLFANGKFMVKSPNIITGKLDGIEESGEDSWVIYSRGQIAILEDCTLIARKIEGMTDEEWANITVIEGLTHKNHSNIVTILKFRAEHGLLNLQTFFYMIDSEIYPFDQSHFDTGEVIDVREL